jgi:hypothetical protein
MNEREKATYIALEIRRITMASSSEFLGIKNHDFQIMTG